MKKAYAAMSARSSRNLSVLEGSPAAYSSAVAVTLDECTLVYLSGMVGIDSGGTVAYRDIKQQTRQTLANIGSVLERQGGTISDIVRVRIFVSAIDGQAVRDVHDARREFFEEGTFPASTLIRVDGFVRDDVMVEIEADAVIARGARQSS
jgi:2-iminobutanoate/2-iminopropanoate deaminase